MANGPIEGGLWVLHRCDNPPCVRPEHLFLGTAKDNTQDMIRKGRAGRAAPRGERVASAKLTDAQVIEIRERFAGGELRNALAAEFGLDPGSVGNILAGRTWRHVGGPIREPGQIGRRPLRKKEAA